mgnify:FL=1|jgi:hypothetical protein
MYNKIKSLSGSLRKMALDVEADRLDNLFRKIIVDDFEFKNISDVVSGLSSISPHITGEGLGNKLKLVKEYLKPIAKRESGESDGKIDDFLLNVENRGDVTMVAKKAFGYISDNQDKYQNSGLLDEPHEIVQFERSGWDEAEGYRYSVDLSSYYDNALKVLDSLLRGMRSMESDRYSQNQPYIEADERQYIVPAKYEVGDRVKVYASNPYKYMMVGSNYQEGAEGEISRVQLRNNSPAEYSVLFYFDEDEGGNQFDLGIMEEDIRPLD